MLKFITYFSLKKKQQKYTLQYYKYAYVCAFCSVWYLLRPLDGAKKPWDRANSADRSMGSRWGLKAAQPDAERK